jgi:hypothetical protein
MKPNSNWIVYVTPGNAQGIDVSLHSQINDCNMKYCLPIGELL